jgi:hypothetical protein
VAVAVQIRRGCEPAGVSRRINVCVARQFNVAETARISTVGSFAFVCRDSVALGWFQTRSTMARPAGLHGSHYCSSFWYVSLVRSFHLDTWDLSRMASRCGWSQASAYVAAHLTRWLRKRNTEHELLHIVGESGDFARDEIASEMAILRRNQCHSLPGGDVVCPKETVPEFDPFCRSHSHPGSVQVNVDSIVRVIRHLHS